MLFPRWTWALCHVLGRSGAFSTSFHSLVRNLLGSATPRLHSVPFISLMHKRYLAYRFWGGRQDSCAFPHLTLHTLCSRLVFTPRVHASCSHLVFTPRVHTSSSHLVFTPRVHTSCSRACSSIAISDTLSETATACTIPDISSRTERFVCV